MRSVELFAGAGGLGLGCELAGFHSEVVAEWDKWACDSVRQNQSTGYPLVSSWRVIEGDVRGVDWRREVEGEVDLVSGGPPCQPFSMGGKHRAAEDARDMFPAVAEVVRQLRPRAFLVENVKGLTRSTFANYFQYIQLRLALPEIHSRPGEEWIDHYHRLQVELTTPTSGRLQYNLIPTLVNAADFGVPQQRHRVFIVGFRTDIEAEWSFPQETHSLDALLWDQWVTGQYWDRHKVAKKHRPEIPDRLRGRVQRLRKTDAKPLEQPWRTVRDALVGLPEPTVRGSRNHLNHVLQVGARPYPGHTGSPLDLPAKTLKAGDHGVPGGENMLRYPDGRVRYFTVRESARLQTFPDRYELHGSWTEAMRQLGNAVPVLLAQTVASSVATHLALADLRSNAKQIGSRRRRNAG